MIGKTNAVSGDKIKIPSVSNLNVDEWGDLTFVEPDYSKLAEYNPTISYIVDVNGASFETPYNNVNLLHLLVEGENTVGVTVKAVLKDFSSDTSENIMFSIPQYTNPTLFTLEATTVDNVNGYKITAYNGTDIEISIPPQNTDGLPILELNSIAVPKINGSHIKKLNSFQNNNTIKEVNFPETTNTSFERMFMSCNKLSQVNLNTSNATNLSYLFYSCSSLITAPWLDTSKATSSSYMFSECPQLKTIPLYDTNSITNMSYMFRNCSVLETIPQFNTGKVTDMSYMFAGCSSLTSIPQLDTSKVRSMMNLFNGCSSLKTIPLLDTGYVSDMVGMFNGCSALTSVPLLNTRKIGKMNYMFQNCSALTEIPALDASNVDAFTSTFKGCSSLTAIHMTGMKASFDISASTQFTDNDLHEIIDNLATVSSTQTLTMGATNLAKVSQEYVAKATNKGWTLA